MISALLEGGTARAMSWLVRMRRLARALAISPSVLADRGAARRITRAPVCASSSSDASR
jgi:hypothetical protein